MFVDYLQWEVPQSNCHCGEPTPTERNLLMDELEALAVESPSRLTNVSLK
jgi:hypothetical protein